MVAKKRRDVDTYSTTEAERKAGTGTGLGLDKERGSGARTKRKGTDAPKHRRGDDRRTMAETETKMATRTARRNAKGGEEKTS